MERLSTHLVWLRHRDCSEHTPRTIASCVVAADEPPPRVTRAPVRRGVVECVCVKECTPARLQLATHCLHPCRLSELDTLWVGAVLASHRAVIEAPELMAPFDDLHSRVWSSRAPHGTTADKRVKTTADLQAAVLSCCRIDRNHTRGKVRKKRAVVVPACFSQSRATMETHITRPRWETGWDRALTSSRSPEHTHVRAHTGKGNPDRSETTESKLAHVGVRGLGPGAIPTRCLPCHPLA